MAHAASRLEGYESGNPGGNLPARKEDGLLRRRLGRSRSLRHSGIDDEKENPEKGTGRGLARRRRSPEVFGVYRPDLLQRSIAGRPRRAHETAEPFPAAFHRSLAVMQILIVHDDAEVGEQLEGMVADYTRHQCDRVENDAAALRWSQTHARCDLLITQLEGAGVDGLTLGASLSEVF